ncbi:hypothetical protein ABIA52_001943 [Paenarthrobacter histidinolovorans]|uniref:Uncharacterized protein n=1 Tax=Paenarthrobacter histidinolovorans TaxID=43664 RepID=A0ABW8N654_9MICC
MDLEKFLPRNKPVSEAIIGDVLNYFHQPIINADNLHYVK